MPLVPLFSPSSTHVDPIPVFEGLAVGLLASMPCKETRINLRFKHQPSFRCTGVSLECNEAHGMLCFDC